MGLLNDDVAQEDIVKLKGHCLTIYPIYLDV